jgi:hypothetical protein
MRCAYYFQYSGSYRTTSDPYVSAGRHFGRSMHIFVNMNSLIVNGMIRNAQESQEELSLQ